MVKWGMNYPINIIPLPPGYPELPSSKSEQIANFFDEMWSIMVIFALNWIYFHILKNQFIKFHSSTIKQT